MTKSLKKLCAGLCLLLAVALSLVSAGAAFAKNGLIYQKRGTTPLAVTVSYYTDIYSRGVAWTTMAQTKDSTLQYVADAGTDPSGADFSAAAEVTGSVKVTDGTYYTHKAAVTDLRPGGYYYRVGSKGDGSWSDVGRFDVDAGSGEVTFLFTTDPQDYDEVGFTGWKNLVAKAYETVPEAKFMACGGDVVNNSYDAADHDLDQWILAADLPKQNFMNSVFMPVSGNHDRWDTSFTDRFHIDYAGSVVGGGYSSFDYGPMHFVMLNTNESGTLRETQIKWLKEDLAATVCEWKIILMHKGLISTGDHSKDSDVAEWRNLLFPVMAAYDVDMVLQGHDHCYVRSRPYSYGQREGGGTYDGRTPNAAETLITETKGEASVTYSVEPDGTFYVTGGFAGRKSYPPVAYDASLIFPALNPYTGKPMSVEVKQQMFSSITVSEGELTFDAYTYDGADAKIYDSYYVRKNTQRAAEKIAKKIPAADEITILDAMNIIEAREAYNALVNNAKKKFSSALLDNLEAAAERFDLEAVPAAYEVAAAIEALPKPEISPEGRARLRSIQNAYAELTPLQQSYVSNYGRLEAYESGLYDLFKAEAVTDMIERYLAGQEGVTIDAVRDAYAGLTDAQKSLVRGADNLDLSEKKKSGCAGTTAAAAMTAATALCAAALRARR